MCILALGVKKHEHSVDIEVEESKDIRICILLDTVALLL